MAKYRVTGPDGSTYEVSAPEGASEADVMAYVQANASKAPPVDETVLDANDARAKAPQRSLNTARLASPVTRFLEQGPADAVLGLGQLFTGNLLTPFIKQREQEIKQARTLEGQDTSGIDWPAAAGSAVTSAALIPGKFYNPVASQLGRVGQGIGLGATSGAMGLVNEADTAGDIYKQKAVQGIVGGGIGGLASAVTEPLIKGATSVYNAVGPKVAKAFGAGPEPITPGEITVKINAALGKQGIDFAKLSAEAQAAIRATVEKQLKTGGKLDGAALARMAEFKGLGIDPLRAWVSRDPAEFTQMENLRRLQAAQGNGSPLIDRLVTGQQQIAGTVAGMGKGYSGPVNSGTAVIGSVKRTDEALKAGVDALYSQARAKAGVDIPLNTVDTIGGAFDALAKEGKLQFLPGSVRSILNDLQAGKGVLTVESAEGLKSTISNEIRKAQRAADGNTVRALSKAYDAIENAPPAIELAQEAADAFKKARLAAKARFDWQKSAPGIEAALDDMAPDQFVQRYVIGGAARDVAALKKVADKATWDQVRGQVIDYIQSRGFGAAGNVNPTSFNKALKDIGDDKLKLLFSPEEVQQLKLAGRASINMVTQPVGSAVNNSNSATTLGAWTLQGLDKIGAIADKLPFGKAAVRDPLESILVSRAVGQQMGTPVVATPPRPLFNAGSLIPRATPAAGLLAANGVILPQAKQERDKARRN